MKTHWNVSIGINDKYIFVKNGNIKKQSPSPTPSTKKLYIGWCGIIQENI